MLWKEYQKEKYNREVIESANGFIIYGKYPDGSVYISELYVTKEARNQGEGKRLEEILIKKEEPTMIFIDIDMKSNGWELALTQIVRSANYKYDSTIGDRIVLYKELK